MGKLPTLLILRARAEAAGIDISDLGRAKKKIMARLAAARSAPPPAADPPKRKRTKTAPALSPVTVVQMPEPVLLSEGLSVQSLADVPPPKVDLQALSDDEPVDIAGFLRTLDD